MLEALNNGALSKSYVVIQEISRDIIRKHTNGTNNLLNRRGAQTTKCVKLLSEVLIMRLHCNYYPQEE